MRRKNIVWISIAIITMTVSLFACGKEKNVQESTSKNFKVKNVAETTAKETTTQETTEKLSVKIEETTVQPITEAPTMEVQTTTVLSVIETAPYVVSTTTEEVYSEWQRDSVTGVKTRVHTTNIYDQYSDGTQILTSQSSVNEYDYSEMIVNQPSANGDTALTGDVLVDGNSAYSQSTSYIQQVLNLTNAIRAEVGVAPLTLDVTLSKAAGSRAAEIAYYNCFSHTRPDGTDCFTIFDPYGITFHNCGENIAAGQETPEEVVTSWKNSPGHYANMINADFTMLGVGYVKYSGFEYQTAWVQLFVR